jgi:hypothetical protein
LEGAILNLLITSVFDNRDSADLALMRLRRKGIHFSVADLSYPKGESAVFQSYSPYNYSPLSPLGANDPFIPPIGSRAIFSRIEVIPKGDTTLTVRVPSEESSRAADILRSAQGRQIRLHDSPFIASQ